MKRSRRFLTLFILSASFALFFDSGFSVALIHAFSSTSQIHLEHRPNREDPFQVQFRDVTSAARIHFHHERASSAERLYLETMGAGVAWLDYNQDGYMDAFFVNSGYTPLFHPKEPPQPALYRNNGDGTFTDVTVQSKIHSSGTFFFGVAVGDYDNDGYPDIFMTGYRHSVLLHNNGDGTFTDVTAKAGVGDDGNWATSAGWFDYDRDGKLDLLVLNYVQYDVDHPIACHQIPRSPPKAAPISTYCRAAAFTGVSPRLYHNNGDGTFTDVTEQTGLTNTNGKGLGLVLADLNNDGWPDIFIANDSSPSTLYFNNGNGTFRNATVSSGLNASAGGRNESAMAADAADIMNNGLMDLFVSHPDYELDRLYRNNGDGTFTDDTVAAGIGQSDLLNSSFGVRFFDWDNDGWRDLLIVNGNMLDNVRHLHPELEYEEPKKLYRNTGDGNYVDATKTQGADFTAPRVGRGLAVGDYDNDGWLDFLVNNNGEDAQLFRNEGGSSPQAKGNHWIGLRLVGTKSNRDGNGAHIKLVAGDLTSYDQVKGGMSYLSSQDPRVYFGLGARSRVDRIEIWWPSGEKDTLENLPVDVILTVIEGKNAVTGKFPPVRPPY
ncbi:MAG TPA: CRTAC1 family protein [Candidatus Acidoferrum sp.]|nr:CRTAC1 family protein [Candidatus Acidoferrum sp.]